MTDVFLNALLLSITTLLVGTLLFIYGIRGIKTYVDTGKPVRRQLTLGMLMWWFIVIPVGFLIDHPLNQIEKKIPELQGLLRYVFWIIVALLVWAMFYVLGRVIIPKRENGVFPLEAFLAVTTGYTLNTNREKDISDIVGFIVGKYKLLPSDAAKLKGFAESVLLAQMPWLSVLRAEMSDEVMDPDTYAGVPKIWISDKKKQYGYYHQIKPIDPDLVPLQLL